MLLRDGGINRIGPTQAKINRYLRRSFCLIFGECGENKIWKCNNSCDALLTGNCVTCRPNNPGCGFRQDQSRANDFQARTSHLGQNRSLSA